MNKYIYTILSLAIMCSCVRMEVLESSNIAGLWACMYNGEQANIFYRFENGTATRYESSERFTVAENTLWHCGETQFESFSAGGYRYSVEGDVVKIGDGGKSDGKFTVDGNTMEWNGVRYAKIDSMSESFYTSINVSNKTVPAQYKRSTVSVPYVIEHPISEGSMTAACLNEWVSNVVIGKDQLSFTTAENTGNERSATITLRYPGAEDVVLTIVQESGTTEIVLPNSSVNTDYAAKNLSFAYSISCPHDGQQLLVSSSTSWISNISASSSEIYFKIAENNSGASRSGKISLTYGTVTKEFILTQSYDAPGLTISPVSLTTNYTTKNLSFTASILNPREGWQLAASTTNSWITDITISGNTVSYKVAENNDGAQRTGQIRLTYGSISSVYSLTQTYSASSITIIPVSQETDYTAKDLSLKYYINNPRDGFSIYASTSDTWITDTQVSGTTVAFKIAENNSRASRTGKIKLTYGNVSEEFSISQGHPDALDGHRFVDLGLSVVWATCNVGASLPEANGGHYQWAGTRDISYQGSFGWNKCPYHTTDDGSPQTGWTKYIPSNMSTFWSGTGSPDNKTVLDPEDDVAHVVWGDSWRMPTSEDWQDLVEGCSWTWTTINGKDGYKVQSKKPGYTNNWIFLPAAGFWMGNQLASNDTGCSYWSSSLHTGQPFSAYYGSFNNVKNSATNIDCTKAHNRYLGFSVRPVSDL